MFGRSRKRAQHEVDQVRIAQMEQARAEAVLRLVKAQQPEVDERLGRIDTRERVNNFGEALTKAMKRRESAA